ncbi:glycosyltransferase family 2 protein [Prevotella communis]|uniref:glycosyltransferase family 2 protein n=1 Tax=Prevotella communis TaxID=2913614 RepID=UPI001EDB5E87|nr:glycosyltransferase family 2 protein [Prevotella communis]UKK55567.1 glycosyltransferase family 2 protein [Prevotella communis]
MAKLEIIVSIITINYNGLKDTCELIEALPFEDKSIEVIVVDNASKEDEAAIITNRYPQVKVIRSEKNLGFAGGNNLGIKAAQGKYLFFINNDALISEKGKVKSEKYASAFQPLIERLESSEKIGIVCPKIRFAWGEKPIQFAGYTPLSSYTMRNRSIGFGETDKGQYDTAHPTPYAHGAAMMVKREALEKVGLMPECYFLYYEELDWSMMFTRAGYTIWYEPACTIYHKESQATGQNSPLKTYYLTRNRLLFVKRNIKRLQRYITYTYLLLVVATRDICRYIMCQQFNLVSATIKGIKNFILER